MTFALESSRQSWQFQAETEQECNNWVQTLKSTLGSIEFEFLTEEDESWIRHFTEIFGNPSKGFDSISAIVPQQEKESIQSYKAEIEALNRRLTEYEILLAHQQVQLESRDLIQIEVLKKNLHASQQKLLEKNREVAHLNTVINDLKRSLQKLQTELTQLKAILVLVSLLMFADCPGNGAASTQR